MSASGRDDVNQSHPKAPVARAHAAQLPQHLAAVKTNATIGRTPVNQSPLPIRTNS
jgi:hypothetical protein